MSSTKSYIDGLLDALKTANKLAYKYYFSPYTDAKIISLDGFEREIFDLIKTEEKSYNDLPL